MPRFTRAELESFHGAEVPDLVGPGVRLVFVGINPGLMTAALQIHFGNPGNRFRPALVGAGLLEPPVDGRPGMTDEDLATLVSRGVGITNLVPFATARADELTRAAAARGPRPARGASSPSTGPASSRCSGSRRTASRSSGRRRRAVVSPSRSVTRCSGWCRTPAASTPTRRSPPWPSRTPSRPGRPAFSVSAVVERVADMTEHAHGTFEVTVTPRPPTTASAASSSPRPGRATSPAPATGSCSPRVTRADITPATSRSRSSTARSTIAPARSPSSSSGSCTTAARSSGTTWCRLRHRRPGRTRGSLELTIEDDGTHRYALGYALPG